MSNNPPYFYNTEVEWSAGRKGHLRSPGLSTMEVASPPEFNGPGGFWTPEHLYAAAVNSCFMNTFVAIAQLSNLEFASFKCFATGKLEKEEGRGFRVTEIVLRPTVAVSRERDVERAERILAKAERNCLISNSINTLVTVEPEVICDAIREMALAGEAPF